MPTTITISKETKEMLSHLKEDRTWDEFLRDMLEAYRRENLKRALTKLRKIEFDSTYEEVRLKLRLKE